MKGIHVNWTKPVRAKNGIEYFEKTNLNSKSKYFSTLYTALSALWWKELNGPIKLITDTQGLSEYDEIGLTDVYDDVDTDTLDRYDGNTRLWTGGKIYSLGVEPLPFAFFDNDLIIRSHIDDSYYYKDIGFTHWEVPRGSIYNLSVEQFEEAGLKSGVHVDFDVMAINTSFFYVGSSEFQKHMAYEHSLNKNLSTEKITPAVWMFTDQVIPTQILRHMGGTYFTLDCRTHLPQGTATANDLKEKTDVNFNNNLRIGEIPDWIYPKNFKENRIEYYHYWTTKLFILREQELYDKEVSLLEEELSTKFPQFSYLVKS